MNVNSFLMDLVEFGYRLPFIEYPPRFEAPNNKSSLANKSFVEQSINDLLSKGLIKQIQNRPFCCNPLTVAENKKLRLVLDLRHVNQYVTLQKFKYEDLGTLSHILETGDYFTTFDLVSGYHHVDIHPDYWKYLGFKWTFSDGITRFFIFLVLPFGLSTACYIFTKLLRPFVKKWRSEGVKAAIYIDDGINAHSSFESCNSATKNAITDLEDAGFVINYTKSKLKPVQFGEWLGTEIDTQNMIFKVPDEKIEKLHDMIASVLSSSKTNAKYLSRITGKLSSMHLSLGPIVRLFTRNIYIDIENRQSWFKNFTISTECKNELKFWFRNLSIGNGHTIKQQHTTSQILFTDASDKSYGSFILKRLEKRICFGNFSQFEKTQSSTARELLAIQYSLQSFAKYLTHQAVNVRTDNINAAKIIEVGSPKPHLQTIAISIFETCLKNDIKLSPTWIPREQNYVADSISKLKDTDDWSIDKNSFENIQKIYGRIDFDRFADNSNTKCCDFNSKFYCPLTKGVDAFTCDWSSSKLNWLCPPVKLIGDCITHLQICKAKGILIIPEWPSCYFWPKIFNGFRFKSFIKHFYVFKPRFLSSSSNNIFNDYANFNMLALYTDFSDCL